MPNEPCGWWRGRVKLVKGEFCVVEYGPAEAVSRYSEILPEDKIRPVDKW